MKSQRIKRILLCLSKWLGLFQVARYLTRRALRIICYHGFALEDEAEFRPRLFMTPRTFQERLGYLQKKNFPIVSLDNALVKMDRGEWPSCATVITIDDGFYSVFQAAAGLLGRFSFPATIYVSTYYVQRESPIFRLAVQYIFWKSVRRVLDLSELSAELEGHFTLAVVKEKEQAMWAIIRFGEEQCDEQRRGSLVRHLASLLAVDLGHIRNLRVLSLMNVDEIRNLAERGFDIQLHSHRHRLPLDEVGAQKEIFDNRAVLEPLVGRPLRHFCYPSGVWSQQHWPWLRAAGIRSATTCEPGLNLPGTNRYALKRFLDGENISQIEFEAEMCGYAELLRRVRSFFVRSRTRLVEDLVSPANTSISGTRLR